MVLRVQVNVPLEYLVEGPEHSFEGVAVHLHALDFCASDHVCSPRLITKQCKLSEIITRRIVLNSLGLFSRVQHLRRVSLSLHEEEHVTSLVAFFDYGLALGEPAVFKGLGYLRSLVVVHGLQQWHFPQELLVLFSLSNSCIFHNMIKGLAVQGIQYGVTI